MTAAETAATMNTARSSQLYERARDLLPGGVNSPVRAMRSIGRDPIFIASGSGSTITDVDGNDYIDWVSSWGPLILGHADPDIVAAVTAAAANGTTFGAPTEAEVELAQQVADRIPSVEMMRMTSSGTEATMSAIRLARAVTGRDKVLKFAGAYHGHVDGLLAEAGLGARDPGHPGEPGRHRGGRRRDPGRALERRRYDLEPTADDDLAAILVEPVPANMGVVPPAAGSSRCSARRPTKAARF